MSNPINVNPSDMTVRAQSCPWNGDIEFQIRADNAVVSDLTFSKLDVGSIVKPTGVIPRTAAQTLMDDLWNAGIRPTEGSGSAGSMRATEKHLEDMRKIAFRGLGMDE